MLKRFVIVCAVSFGLVGSCLADSKGGGIARQVAMGGSQAGSQLILNPFIMNDPSLQLLNPAYQSMYRDYAWMNIGGGTVSGTSSSDNGYGQQNAGVNFALSDNWTLGAILSYDPSAVNLFTFADPSIPPVANVWEAVVSYSKDSWKLGFGFMYGNSNSDTTASSTGGSYNSEHFARLLGFRGGFSYDMGSGNSLDLSAAVHLDKAESNATLTSGTTSTTGSQTASATEFIVTARYKHKASEKWNVIPIGVFATTSTEPEINGSKTGMKISATVYSFGIGGEYRASGLYLAGGLSYQSAQVKLEDSSSTSKARLSSLPTINVGGEWWFTDWLAGRAGYYRANMNLNTKLEGGGSSFESNFTVPNSFIFIGGLNPSNNDGVVTLGLGFSFGNFALDATISEQALRRGLGLIGASDNINTFGYINASYNFE